MNGGTFKVKNGLLTNGKGTLEINGGTFNVDPSAYVNSETHTVTETTVEGVTVYVVTAK